MGGILDKLDEWLRGLLIEGITGNLSGMFDTVNTKVGEIAGEVGQTPLAWNSGVFSMIRNLSETVIVPIAGVILTFVMCYELIQLVTEKNNLHDVDTWMFFKWIFKTFCAVLIVTNTWNIVMGIFDVGQSVVNSSAGVIIGNTSIDISSVITDMEAQLEALGTGELFGLWFQSLFVGLTMNALSICIMLVIYGRMIEVYLTTSVGPIPLATMTNRDWSHTGQNYLKSLFALIPNIGNDFFCTGFDDIVEVAYFDRAAVVIQFAGSFFLIFLLLVEGVSVCFFQTFRFFFLHLQGSDVTGDTVSSQR